MEILTAILAGSRSLEIRVFTEIDLPVSDGNNPAQTVTVKICNANYNWKNRNFRFLSLGLGGTTGTSVYSLFILGSSKYYEDGTHVYR